MFSPSLNQAPSGSVRSSRRRRPLSNDDSIVQPKAKRQRSALSEQTFLPPDGTPEMEETKSHKIVTVSKREPSRELTGPRREIAVRGKKSKNGDRGYKGDGSVVLTKNDTYIVSKLPALPDLLRTDATGHQRGEIYPDNGYALALTQTQALVWPYAVNIHSPETFTFALPHPSKHPFDPLPLGSLVSASASSTEPGLVVVMPKSGKIAYWESIASAATLDLIRQQRNGVELDIPGMGRGEEVSNILNAESAGFILSFTTGRLAYMSVRDGQGRPAISIQFLRNSNAPTNGGLFGSIRNALGASILRGDIAAVRAGRPEKVGERNVVVATANGKIQSWNIHRGGHTALRTEADGRETIVQAVKEVQPALRDLLLESFEVLDFTYTPKSATDLAQLNDHQDYGEHLLLLTSLRSPQAHHYSLVEVVLKHGKIELQHIRPIKTYTTEVSKRATRPRLYLPNPALVAYIVFDQAVVVLSMAKQPESPDSQLRIESHLQPQYFEDVVDFRGGNVEVVGSGMEEPHGPASGIEDQKSRRYKAKHPATVLLIRGGGVVRIAATNVERLSSSNAQQVTAKSKLEQAVFFGTIEKNPLNFGVRSESQFPPEEMGDAAMALSLEILKSQTEYIPAVVGSIESNIRQRSAALRYLAEYLKTNDISLSRGTRWRLLQDAEKMKAAATIWKSYDATVKSKLEGQKRGLLADVVESIHEDYKANPVSEAGELDRVRHWFINDIWNLEVAVPWAFQALRDAYQSGQNDLNYIIQMLCEADDIVIGALDAAFEFRTANLALYGLQDEELEHGVLKTNYEGLGEFEFWTSTIFIALNLKKQANLAIGLLRECLKESARGQTKMDTELLQKVRLNIPGLVDLGIRSSTERIRWSLTQSAEVRESAEPFKAEQTTAQDEQLRFLTTQLELGDEAIAIAEKHQMMPTLAAVIMHEITYFANHMNRTAIDNQDFEYFCSRTNLLQDLVRSYFDKFGAKWANALYEHDIEEGEMSNLLDNYQEYPHFLSQFLRSKSEYAKVDWIHEVTREQDFDRAAGTLLDLGLKREQDLWSKKIELSLGKLARMAGRKKYSQANGILIPDKGQIELVSTDQQLGLIKIQDRVYEHVMPAIADALDDKAELQLALEGYGNKYLKKHRAFASLLEEAMGHLVRHESMNASTLIDLLTLMGGNEPSQDETGFQSQRFYLALQASCYGISSNDEQNLTQQVIWRRCMLRDDWAVVNNTELKDDQEVNDQLRGTSLYMTFRACIKNGMFKDKSPVIPINPQDILGAFTEELPERFDRLDANLRDGILKDMRTEDDSLKPFLKTCRLEKWYQSVLDLARQDSTAEEDEEAVDSQKMPDIAEKLRIIEQEITERERVNAQKALHSRGKTFDAAKGKFRGSTQLQG